MYCPACRTEYRVGFTVCADCGADLVPQLPPEPEAPKPIDDITLVEVFRTSERFQADAVLSVLDGEGIPGIVRPDLFHIPEFMVESAMPGQSFVVLIPDRFEADARAVISAMLPNESAPDLGIRSEPIVPGDASSGSASRWASFSGLQKVAIIAAISAALVAAVEALSVVRDLLR